MKLNRGMLAAAALLGFLGVAAGAFASHGLSGRISPERLDTWHIGARLHMYHALALLACAALPICRTIRLAAVAFVFGVIVFSGSLYLLAITDIRWLGAITPIGGVALLVGWTALFVRACYRGKSRSHATNEPRPTTSEP